MVNGIKQNKCIIFNLFLSLYFDYYSKISSAWSYILYTYTYIGRALPIVEWLPTEPEPEPDRAQKKGAPKDARQV